MKVDRQTADDWLAHLLAPNTKPKPATFSQMAAMIARLSLDELPGKVVTIAGTNGKGSVVAMLEALCASLDLRSASITSPHLVKVNERFRMNGASVSDAQLYQAFEQIDLARGQVALSYFQFLTLVGLHLLKQTQADIYLLEIGLGGRLDPLRLVRSHMAVITNIALDHCEVLGETREQIAFEKAGIIQEGQVVVTGVEPCLDAIKQAVFSKNVKLFSQGAFFSFIQNQRSWRWQSGQVVFDDLTLPNIMLDNVSLALQVMQLLMPDRLTVAVINDALARINHPGRGQLIPGSPDVLLDVAHNPQALTALCQTIKKHKKPGAHVHLMMGLAASKDIKACLHALLGATDAWYFVPLTGDRGAPVAYLRDTLTQMGEASANGFQTISDARRAILERASKDDLIVVAGSFIVVGQMLDYLRGNRGS
jgi:dihydrofolate synthase / folylpolyglutamate synthase